MWVKIEPIEFYNKVISDITIDDYIMSDIGDSTYYFNNMDECIMLSVDSKDSPYSDIVISRSEFIKIFNIS